MEILRVQVKDGEYLCDIDISVEEWKEILQDKKLLNENYKDVLLKFYAEPEHKSTCKALGIKYNVNPQSFNGTIMNFAKAVQKKLNRFEIKGTDGTPTYWIIPMLGKSVGDNFEWKIRNELVQAITELKIFTETKYWTFKHKPGKDGGSGAIDFVKKAIRLNSAIMQYEYSREGQGNVTQNWNRIKEVRVGDYIFLRGDSDIYAVGKAIRPRKKATVILNIEEIMKNKSHGEYISGKYSGCIHFNDSEVFYEDLSDGEDGWGQRIDVDVWRYFNQVGLYIKDKINYIEGENEFGVLKQLKQDKALSFENELKQNFMDSEIKLLDNNKNLIFTGAPGTGKTYLAKKIALKMLFGKDSEDLLSEEERLIFERHYCFVQFHPSFDYTDFVEGLRAEDLNGQVIFNLHNGIFKAFCKNAIEKDLDNFDEIYNQFVDYITESDISFETPTQKKKFKVEINSNKSCVAIPATEVGTRMVVTKEMIRNYVVNGKIRDWKPYTTAIGDLLKSKYSINSKPNNNSNLPFIFVIDEINRGELSKIFGELFYSIDPGYRGIKGKVKTQYSNIQSGDTVFDEELGQGWFYVPDNVFIIGTMNDIDRSVESMDFAMRRRFAWKEIKAEDRISMWDGRIDDFKEDALKRMKSLNKAIESVQGLSPAYHIGPAYFLKLENYNGNADELWNNHLEGVIFEYLRGLPDAKTKLEELKAAYNNKSELLKHVDND